MLPASSACVVGGRGRKSCYSGVGVGVGVGYVSRQPGEGQGLIRLCKEKVEVSGQGVFNIVSILHPASLQYTDFKIKYKR